MEKSESQQNTIKKDPDFPQVLARRLSLAIFLKPFEKSGLSPNQITVANFLINNLAAVYFFSKGNYISNLLGLFFCLLSGVLDYIDGTIARRRQISSRLGEWLDSCLDLIWQIMLVYAIAIGVFIKQGQNLFWLLIGFFSIIGLAASNYISKDYQNKFKLDLYKDTQNLKKIFAQGKLIFPDTLYANIITPSSFLFIFLFTIRYFIVIGALFNIMHLVLILIMFFSVIRSIILFYIFVLYFQFQEGKKVKHTQLFELLNKYIQAKLE